MSYSVVIPFHAEPDAALATVRSLQFVIPAPVEIVLVDDGSPHPIPPGTILPPGTRLVRLERNRGKAGALQAVLRSLGTEVIVCMDADTQSESCDWSAMLSAFDDASLGAVTGKIRPTEGGGLLTVSGAFTAYRTSALHSVNG